MWSWCLLGTLLPPLTLVLINFSKNFDFSDFSQFLLLKVCKLGHTFLTSFSQESGLLHLWFVRWNNNMVT